MPRFVVQHHQSRNPHYDFRLERDGLFKSWAVPKGLPDQAGVRHLALQVDDHSIAFGAFEGDIPPGEYGAGTITIWDQGTYDLYEWREDLVVFTLHGVRSQGTYNLVQFRHKGDREWLLFKRSVRELTNSESGSEPESAPQCLHCID